MKNVVYIDVDTERDQPLLIGKPPEVTPPENPEDAALMIKTDISCVCEALASLIQVASTNGYGNKKQLIDACISTLNSLLDFNNEEEKDSTETNS